MERSAPIPGSVLAVAAAAPFVVSRVAGGLLVGHGAVAGGHVLCPLRAATGIPCPLCGATRSVVLASRGDLAFLHFNPVWVIVLAALAVAGAALALAHLAGVEVPRERIPARARWALVVLVAAAGWATALAHHAAIAGTA